MKTPKRLQPLVEDGLIDQVLRALMTGKEAKVYTVRCGTEIRCAKVYKEADKRSFKKAVTYQEGRKVRNSRRGRAMQNGSKFGRQEQEDIWQHAEVNALYTAAAADVRVPQPYGCFDGVLLMDLITDAEGQVAPRLNDVSFDEAQALEYHQTLMRDVVKLLCAGLVHGDLSPFNVLVDAAGPVIIDLPQAVDAAANNNASAMLERDVDNITQYFGQFAPQLLNTAYGKEIWQLYEDGELMPDSPLTGTFIESTEIADVDAVLAEVYAAMAEEEERQVRLKQNLEED